MTANWSLSNKIGDIVVLVDLLAGLCEFGDGILGQG
jgi:hypothetical protein